MRGSPWRDIYLTWISEHLVGLLTWAQTLAAGANTGGHDPTIDVGDRILWSGTRDGTAATQLVSEAVPAAPVLLTATSAINLDGVQASAGIGLTTGNATATGVGTVTSGALSLSTGQTFDGGGDAGASGLIAIATGVNNGANPLGGGSGDLVLATGASDLGGFSGDVSIASGFSRVSSGQVSIRSGDSVSGGAGANSGQVQVYTGEAYLGSGPLSIYTGLSATGASGDLSLSSGDGDSAGDVLLTGGLTNGVGNGAAISLRGGAAATGTGGPVQLNSGVGVAGKGRIELGEPDSSIGVGQQAERVYSLYAEWQGDGFQAIPGRAVWQKKITCQVATTPAAITDDPDFEFQDNHAATVADSTASGLSLIQSTGSAGDYSVIRTDQGAGVSSWGKASLSRGSRYMVGGTVSPSVISGRYEVGARPTTNAFDDTTDDNKTILVFDPAVSPNWQAVTSNGGADNVDDTGIPATGGGALNYKIVINSSNQAEYWLSNPARGGRLELCVVRSVGAGLSGCIMYAGCICNVPASAPQMEWGNPIQAANL